jgi:putative nucleotidyltransferase with HDIG domain
MKNEKHIDLLNYIEIINRPKITNRLLSLSTAATLIIGTALLAFKYPTPGLILLAFSVVSGALMVAGLRNHHILAAKGLVILFPMVITALMIEGEGLHDPGMVGFSIFIIFSTLLLGKQFLPWAWLTTIVMTIIIFIFDYFNVAGLTDDMRFRSSIVDLLTVLILFSVGSAIFWVIMDIIETTMLQVVNGEQQIKDAYDLTLEGWAKALEMRDKETEGHSRRVTELTIQVCQLMGLPDSQIFHIRRGALLHDIGKMAIPDDILHKPNSLTDAEWKIIRQHPENAFEMLKNIQFLSPALEIPLYHHEQWDGRGYPFGLAGDKVPLPARIFAVVDNWDALSSDRSYRPAWKRQKVVDYLSAESGKKFDPQVVEIFLSMVNNQSDS